MGAEGGNHRPVHLVFDLVFVANPLDDASDLGIVDVANPGEEVVDDLEVQSPQVPGDQAVVRREISSGADLMDHPFGLDVAHRNRMRCLLNDVGQREYDAHHQPCSHHDSQVSYRHDPAPVKRQGNDERQVEEYDLPGDQPHKFPPPG